MKSTKTKRKLNVKLLRRIKKHILAEPRRLQMRYLLLRRRKRKTFDADVSKQKFAPCGTAACIAGWAMLLSGVKPYDIDDKTNATNDALLAAELVGIGRHGHWSRLFFASAWPTPFRDRYRAAASQKERAKVAAERIDHLIKTGA